MIDETRLSLLAGMFSRLPNFGKIMETNKQDPNQSPGCYFLGNVPKRNLTFIGEVFHSTSGGIIIYSGLGERLFFFFPKQFTVGVLNATLDLAALVLVGVVGFLGSEVVLSPVVSGCLPSCGRWVLVGVAAFLGSEVVLSPVVSLHVGGGCWLVWPHLEQKHP